MQFNHQKMSRLSFGDLDKMARDKIIDFCHRRDKANLFAALSINSKLRSQVFEFIRNHQEEFHCALCQWQVVFALLGDTEASPIAKEFLSKRIPNTRGGFDWVPRTGSMVDQQLPIEIQQVVLEEMVGNKVFKSRCHVEMEQHIKTTHLGRDDLVGRFKYDDQNFFQAVAIKFPELNQLFGAIVEHQRNYHQLGQTHGEIMLCRRSANGISGQVFRMKQRRQIMEFLYFVGLLQQNKSRRVRNWFHSATQKNTVPFSFINGVAKLATGDWKILGTINVEKYEDNRAKQTA